MKDIGTSPTDRFGGLKVVEEQFFGKERFYEKILHCVWQ